MNNFQSENNRKFLNAIMALDSRKDFKTVERDIQQIGVANMTKVFNAACFDIQLDLWTSRRGETVLVLLMSWIDH